MPNIELHGYNGARMAELFTELSSAFEHVDYRKHIVVSRAETWVQTLDRIQAPFVRLYITPEDEKTNADVEERLRKLNLDVEVVELKKFIPKKE